MADNHPIRVLQVLNHMDYGGIEAVVLNYYRHIDRNRVQFDFAVSEDSGLPQRGEIERLGGIIYDMPKISHIKKYIAVLKNIIREHQYRIVHCHMNTLSVFPLFAAYLAGAKVRICHNHTTVHFGEGKRSLAKYALRPFCKWFATDYFACGEYAGRWMFGDQCFEEGKVYVMRNAVDVERFRFDPDLRDRVRGELGITDKFVIGHIGRFMYQKNHEFLVDVFYEVYKRNKNAVLLLIGEGDLEGRIKEKVKRLGLVASVIFYGSSRDTSGLYQAMDVFCLPSFYEGVPVVAVEAQVSGISVLASEQVSAEIRITKGCERISLEMPPGVWAVRMLKCRTDRTDRKQEYLKMREAGYFIKTEAKRLLEKYFRLYTI